jgi:ubiquitin-conjugating enzyme E2 Q
MSKYKGNCTENQSDSDDDSYYDDGDDFEVDDDSFSVPEETIDDMIKEFNDEKSVEKTTDSSTVLSPDLERHLSEIEKKFIGNSSQMAITRIMKDRIEIAKTELYNAFFEVDFINDNIHIWSLLMRFSETDEIQKSLNDYAEASKGKHPNAIKMEITFPQDYPMSPPFMRVISPKFKYRTGRITIGGSICTELLTSSGWVPTYSIGQTLIQIQSEMIDGKPQIEPYNCGSSNEYSLSEAQEAFTRKAREMGWIK